MKLGLLHKWLVYCSIAFLFATGVLHELSSAALFPKFQEASATYEWEHLLLSAHGVGAMIFLLVFGSLFPVHIKKSWHAGRNLVSGSVLLLCNAVLIITAAILYYGSVDGVRPIAELVHFWGGVLLPFLIAGHLVLGRRQKKPLT